MAISLDSMQMSEGSGPSIDLLYGPEGTGKTTLAAGAPKPVFLQLEDGLGRLKRMTFKNSNGELPKTYGDVDGYLELLATNNHDRATLVVDSMDHLEPVIWAETCRRHDMTSIDMPNSFGRGYDLALEVWKEFFEGLSILRNRKGMGVILIAHARVLRFESPMTEAYDRYTPKLHVSKAGRGANPFFCERVDDIFFINHRTSVVKDAATSTAKGAIKRVRGIGDGLREVYTQQIPAAVAKNRWDMPPIITIPDNPDEAWNTLAQYIPYYTPTQTEVTE